MYNHAVELNHQTLAYITTKTLIKNVMAIHNHNRGSTPAQTLLGAFTRLPFHVTHGFSL